MPAQFREAVNLTALLSSDVPHGSEGFRGDDRMTGVIGGQLHPLKALSTTCHPDHLDLRRARSRNRTQSIGSQLKTLLIRNGNPANHIARCLGGFIDARWLRKDR